MDGLLKTVESMDKKGDTDFSFNVKKLFIPLTNLKIFVIFVFVGFLIYFFGLFNNFISDDVLQIVDNTYVHSILNFFAFFAGSTIYNSSASDVIGLYYKPLLDISYSAIYTIFGANYVAFHFFQLLLNIINSYLLFLVFSYFLKRPIAFILALIFLIHPVKSESVLYIADLQEPLFFFFGITGLLYLIKGKIKLAFLLFFLSVLSKETGILFFIIALFYAKIFKKELFQKSIIFSVSGILLYGLLRILALGGISVSRIEPIARLSFLQRMLNMPEMFFNYIRLFFFPVQLSYSYRNVLTLVTFAHFFLPLLIDFVFLLLLGYGGFLLYKNNVHKLLTIYLFFFSWFAVGIIFHLNIIPLDATWAERWTYFPLAGLLGMIGVLLENYKVSFKNTKVIILLTIIILLLSFRSFTRIVDWQNQNLLANHDIQVSDDYYLEAEIAQAYFDKKDYHSAITHDLISIQRNPYSPGYIDLGLSYAKLKDYKNARQAFLTFAQIEPNTSEPYFDLYLLAFLDTESKKIYIHDLQNGVQNHPREGILWYYLALLEYKFGNKNNAQQDINQAYAYQKSQEIANALYLIMNNKPINITVNR